MALTVTHAKTLDTAFLGDDGDSHTVSPTDWNDSHTITGLASAVRTVKHLKLDYNVVADGVTDDTANFNTAIAAANAAGGNWTFIVPMGTILLSSTPTAIVVDGVYFQGEGAAENCVIKPTATTGIRWSTTTTATAGGGMIEVGLDGDGGVNDAAIVIANGSRMKFLNLHLKSGLGQLAQLGNASSSTQATEIFFIGMRGIVANVAAPLIQGLNGSGLWIDDFDVFVTGNFGSQASGRHFVSFSQGSWDAAEIQDGIAQVFDSPVVTDAASGKTIQSISVHNNFFDQMLNGLSIASEAGGANYAIEVYDNEITARGAGGIGVNFSGTGTHFGERVVRNRILQCGTHGIVIPASAAQFSVQLNDIYGVDQSGGANFGISVASGASYGIISFNNVGVDVSATLGVSGVPQTGIAIGNVTSVQIIGNKSNGSSSGFTWGTLTTCIVRNNQGYTAGVADSTGADRGTLTTNSTTNATSNTSSAALSIVGGAAIALDLFARKVTGQKDINGVGDYQIGVNGLSNPNQQVWFGYDTTNDRGFMQAILQGTSVKPLLLNPNGGNVVVGTAANGSYGIDLTGTLGATGNITAKYGTAIPAGGTQDAGYLFSSTAHFGIIFGSGAPSASMAKGTLYLRSDGDIYTRAYANNDGATGYDTLATARSVHLLQFMATGVNFNSANTDTQINLTYPPGCTRAALNAAVISNASHSLTTATFGVFTQAAAGGAALIAAGTAITVSATATDTANNQQVTGGSNIISTQSASLFFRVGTAEGAAATADVTLVVRFLP